MLGRIFRKAQNKVRDPAKLRQLIVELIGKEHPMTLADLGDFVACYRPGQRDERACATRVSSTPPTSPTPMSWPRRSPKTCGTRWATTRASWRI
jgi:hypothetical protein